MRKVLGLFVLVVVISFAVSASDTLDVVFIDVGAGDAILIDCGDWEALLDAGRGYSAPNAAIRAVLAEHVDDGIIELALLSHPHADHYGGFEAVLGQYEVWEFWRSQDVAPDSSSATYSRFVGSLVTEGLVPRQLERGDQSRIGNIEWRVLGPGALNSGTTNDNEDSLVLLLTYGEVSFLFVGDIESYGEASLLDIDLPDGPLVLKVAHHGSHTSTSAEFLRWSTPDLAVISTKYETPPALAILELQEIPSAMTSRSGTIHVSTDGTSWEAADIAGNALGFSGAIASPGDSRLSLNVEAVAATGQGNDANLYALTTPGANCSITVYYNSGPSTAAGLVEKIADVDGQVTWTWRVGPGTTPGTYRIVVTAAIGGVTISETVWFQVLDTGSPG